MSMLTSVGRFLKRIYLTPEMIAIVLIPVAFYVVIYYTFPWMGQWRFGFLLGGMFFNAWLMKLYRDWLEMYRVGMHMADKTTEMAQSHELRYATIKMNRLFPRRFWVHVVADEYSVRMYQGWSFFGRIPKHERIVKSRIYRQVA